MANTYTQIHIHIIFAVKNRASLLSQEWRQRLFKYITGIFQTNGHKVLAINGVANHVHILIGLKPDQSLSSIIQNVKTESSKWIKRENLCYEFNWQQGFGAFSYAKSQLPAVINYIKNQERHHAKISFREEFKVMLERFGVEYNEQYIFKNAEEA